MMRIKLRDLRKMVKDPEMMRVKIKDPATKRVK